MGLCRPRIEGDALSRTLCERTSGEILVDRNLKATFQFLGTGASAGVPVVGCKCEICQSASPRNQRLRPSGLIKIGNQCLLIDIGPDFRQQALRYQIDRVDGLLLTHTHYDHIAGIDELRIFFVREKRAVPCLLSKESYDDLHKRYDYLFKRGSEKGSLTAQLELQVLEKNHGETEFLGQKIGYVSFFQGGMKVTGFRLGRFAYISDIRDYDDAIFDYLRGVEVLVLSALRSEPSPLHLSLEEAVAFSRKVGAKLTRLTHIAHAIDHETANRALPPDVQLGYDGLKLEFSL